MAYSLKINVYNNRDYEQSFTLTDGNNSPMNLVNSSLVFSIDLNGKVLSFSSANVNNKCVFVTNGVTGQIKLVLPYSVLKSIPAGTYKHDLIVVGQNGWRTGVWAGTINIKSGVSV